MAVYKLDGDQTKSISEEPEVAMDIQIVQVEEQVAIVIGCRLAITLDEHLEANFSRMREVMELTGIPSGETYGQRLVAWTQSLDDCPPITVVPKHQALTALALIHLGPRGVMLGMPARPSYIYGHLPHHGTCDGSDVFYRYEAYPTSIRIDRKANKITKRDTYAAPASEAPFTPTGLSAVGRFALPSLAPHCTRWELTPKNGTPVHYGASVPLYGQSGGGVEIMLPKPFDNAVPIPNPTILPIL